MEPPSPSYQPLAALPKRSDLSPQQLAVLDEHFTSRNDLLHLSRCLLSRLISHCSDLDHRLLHLRRDLTKCAVSWISQSFSARLAVRSLGIELENLCLRTSIYGNGGVAVQRNLFEELFLLAKELRRLENIRKYVGIALKLEALVGDLEDSVLYAANNHRVNLFQPKFSNPSVSTDSALRQERFDQAIKAMNEIEGILLDVLKVQPQWRSIVESVDTRVDKTLSVLRPQIIAEYRTLLVSLGWPPKLTTSKAEHVEVFGIPNPLLLMQGEKKESYSQRFLVLCALQHIQMQREIRRLNLSNQKEIGLWAIDELVLPIASRMEYHFTKWVDQPEHIFALVYKVTRDFSGGVDDVLQPLIDRARLVSCSAKEAWVSAMVQVLSGFLTKRIFPHLTAKYKEEDMKSEVISSWLHLMDLIIAFDKRMQSLVSSETSFFWEDTERFEGLSRGMSVMGIFCEKPEWLKTWAKVELKDACKELKAELKDEKAWLICSNKFAVDFESNTAAERFILSTREDHRAPSAAESALKLTWKLVERGLSLPAVLPRIQFVRATAIKFLWYFFKILLLQFRKTEFSHENLDEIVVIRVCGLINAARYIESKLQERNDDLHFVEMRLAETSSKICKKPEGPFESCFFVDEVKSLVELETNWLMEIITVLLHQFENLSWGYFKNKELFAEEDSSSPNDFSEADLNVSHAFAEALDSLRSHLHVLKTNLNSKDFLDLWRTLAQGLDHFISRNIFSDDIHVPRKWTDHFGADVRALFLVFQPFCSRPEAFFPCVREALRLLNMSEEEVKHLQAASAKDGNGKSCLSLVGFPHLSYEQVDKFLRCNKFRT